MTEKTKEPNSKVFESQHSALESHYIDDFLKMKGCSREDLGLLPEDQAKKLMIEASRYASMKLAEHEARAKFRQEIKIE